MSYEKEKEREREREREFVIAHFVFNEQNKVLPHMRFNEKKATVNLIQAKFPPPVRT